MQFHESELSLLSSVRDFIDAGVSQGEGILIVAARVFSVEDQESRFHSETQALRMRGQLVYLETETLGSPHREITLNTALLELRASFRRVRIHCGVFALDRACRELAHSTGSELLRAYPINELNRLEQQAEEHAQMESMLRRTLSMREEFLSSVSHELKTPLTALKFNTQLYQSRLQRNADALADRSEVEKLLMRTNRQIDRICRVLDHMLDHPPLENGKFAPIPASPPPGDELKSMGA